MTKIQRQPFGSWPSIISSDFITQNTKVFQELQYDLFTSSLYWIEGIPEEKGRCAIVSYKKGDQTQHLPSLFSAKTKIHEYGGGSFCVANDSVFFTNYEDQNIYCIKGETITCITQDPSSRFGEYIFDRKRNFLYCLCEREIDNKVVHLIVKIDLFTKQVSDFFTGYDFFSSLAIRDDGNAICFVCWNFPNMPWDESYLIELHLSEQGDILSIQEVVKKPNISICLPSYHNHHVYYLSDESGFWNLYIVHDETEKQLSFLHADIGIPVWVLGQRRYCFTDQYIALIYTEKGVDQLGLIDLLSLDFNTFDTPYTFIKNICSDGEHLYFIGSNLTTPAEIVKINLQNLATTVIKKSKELTVDPSYFSHPTLIEFPSSQGLVYGIFYPPHHPQYRGMENELPPVIFKAHGGPTSHVPLAFDAEAQFFTSRGFGYCSINYGGSSGFGRKYRERLKGNWGIVDVQDMIQGASYLTHEKKADSNRLIIKGGSAGGFTTLSVLSQTTLFQAGVFYYGVADVTLLAEHTHSFESRYLDQLIGPYPLKKALYETRSPIHHIDKITASMLLFQGGKDKVVPPKQTQMVHDALVKRGTPVTYIFFEEEGHGFVQSGNIKAAIEAELSFYKEVFSLEPKRT
ncbi:MAG: S9 family peptidase [Chlamydiales bacterium]|nr:S9 family peptidase [Chlamydiales bacterium]